MYVRMTHTPITYIRIRTCLGVHEEGDHVKDGYRPPGHGVDDDVSDSLGEVHTHHCSACVCVYVCMDGIEKSVIVSVLLVCYGYVGWEWDGTENRVDDGAGPAMAS